MIRECATLAMAHGRDGRRATSAAGRLDMGLSLFSAICLVLVIEGLFLFAAPRAWQQVAEQMRRLEPRQLRIIGAVMIGVGVVALQLLNWMR